VEVGRQRERVEVWGHAGRGRRRQVEPATAGLALPLCLQRLLDASDTAFLSNSLAVHASKD
jgi:hypothetical protein